MSVGQQFIRVNNLGFIDFWSEDNNISAKHPIYMVYFKDHSHLDPTCPHLDTNAKVTNTQIIGTKKISYDKQIENNLLQATLEIGDNWLHWKFSIVNKYFTGHRFGVVYPTDFNASIYSDENCIDAPIANYFHSLSPSFRDQALVDVPLFTIHNLIYTSFCSSPDFDIQFFHNDLDCNVRMTVSTNNTDFFDLIIYRHSSPESGKNFFIDRYPESAKLLNKWIGVLQQLGQEYKLHITYHAKGGFESYAKSYTYDCPTDKDLRNFVSLFSHEINKYSPTAFQKLEIDNIVLVKSMFMNYQNDDVEYQVHGFLSPSSFNTRSRLLLDVEYLHAWIIHHEIFHAIDRKVNFEGWPQGNYDLFEAYFGMKEIAWEYDVDDYADEEFRADLFSQLMIDQARMDSIASGNILLQKQISVLKDKIKNWVSFPSTPNDDNRTIYLVDDGHIISVPFGDLINGNHFVSQI